MRSFLINTNCNGFSLLLFLSVIFVLYSCNQSMNKECRHCTKPNNNPIVTGFKTTLCSDGMYVFTSVINGDDVPDTTLLNYDISSDSLEAWTIRMENDGWTCD